MCYTLQPQNIHIYVINLNAIRLLFNRNSDIIYNKRLFTPKLLLSNKFRINIYSSRTAIPQMYKYSLVQCHYVY